MPINPWNFVFAAGFLVYLGIRGLYEHRAKTVETREARVDGLEYALMGLVFIGCVFLPVAFLFTPWLAFADLRLPAMVPWLGTIAMVASLWLFWRSHRDLGSNWSRSLEVRTCHQLIRHGVYARIRHPMYAGILLFCLAQAALLANWLAGWSGFASFGMLYLVRRPREEAMLREAFGDEYRDYQRQTGRLFPRFFGR